MSDLRQRRLLTPAALALWMIVCGKMRFAHFPTHYHPRLVRLRRTSG